MSKIFTPFTTNEIKPHGWLLDQLKIQANSLSGNLDKMWPDVKDSSWIGGTKDGWERVPYWLDGFIPLAYYGIQTLFVEWYVWYALIKSLFFAFVISSIASFFGYHVTGGALQVGKASTNAVVTSSILILLLDVILTNLMLQ